MIAELISQPSDDKIDLTVPIQNEQVISEAWSIKESRDRLAVFIRDGILKDAPEVAERVLAKLALLSKSSLSDSDITNSLKIDLQNQGYENKKCLSFNIDEERRINRRAEQIADIINLKSSDSLIDIGCGNGLIAEKLRLKWSLSDSNTYGADVYNRVSDKAQLSFVPVSEDNSFQGVASNKIDLALILMTLHHDQKPFELMQEAYRVIKEGGYLLIRDHDADTAADQLFCEAMDRIYFGVFNQHTGVPIPANYQSIEYWNRLASIAGFTLISDWYPEPGNPMKPFYALYGKF